MLILNAIELIILIALVCITGLVAESYLREWFGK